MTKPILLSHINLLSQQHSCNIILIKILQVKKVDLYIHFLLLILHYLTMLLCITKNVGQILVISL